MNLSPPPGVSELALKLTPTLRPVVFGALYLLVCLINTTNTANADIITMLTGRIGLAPVSLSIENVNAATNVNGVVHVVGQHEGHGARQLVDLATGTVGNVDFFHSIASAQGSTGIRDGEINNVTLLNDGRAIYVGQSYGTRDTEPTYWFDPLEPNHPLAFGQSGSGELYASSANGTLAGTSQFLSAVYGDAAANTLEFLPGFSANRAYGITDDAQFIVGEQFIWNQNEFGGYDVYSTSEFDFSSASDSTPTWVDVAIDPITGAPVFAGAFFDLDIFADRVGFWRADGTLIGTSALGSFSDFEVIDGHLVAAVNGLDDGYLYAMTDFSSISMTEVLGESMQIHALYSGSLGFVGTSAGGGMFIGTATAVPEPSSLLLLATATLVSVGFRRRRRLLITEYSGQ